MVQCYRWIVTLSCPLSLPVITGLFITIENFFLKIFVFVLVFFSLNPTFFDPSSYPFLRAQSWGYLVHYRFQSIPVQVAYVMRPWPSTLSTQFSWIRLQVSEKHCCWSRPSSQLSSAKPGHQEIAIIGAVRSTRKPVVIRTHALPIKSIDKLPIILFIFEDILMIDATHHHMKYPCARFLPRLPRHACIVDPFIPSV